MNRYGELIEKFATFGSPLVCNAVMTEKVVGYMEELPVPALTPVPDMSASASGDFPAHNPKVRFNEGGCPIGSACMAHCAARWLEEHR
ncbi:MAG: hypothetical protein K2K90_02920 [Lachnospiraceae bacterium]|nr:hypothetical protein [Lachnospiraceae bacterium]